MTPPPIPADEHEQLAAEYALGVLTGDDLARARSLHAADADFRAAVGRWLGRLAPLLDEVEPITAPDQLWAAIERRLEPRRSAGNVVQLRRRVTVWRGIAAASSALAASLALVLVARPAPERAPAPVPTQVASAPALVAVLGDEQRPAAVLASWNPSSRSLTLAAADGATPADRARELWVIPGGGTPISLGVMAEQAMSRLTVSEALARQLQQGATLAISLEPMGGSPTGQPTGPVIASGALERA